MARRNRPQAQASWREASRTDGATLRVAEELVHQRALERRAARAAGADPAVRSPALDADELHRRAVAIREYRQGRGPRPAGTSVARSTTASSGVISTTMPVTGMTCRSCEIRIQRFVGQLPGVVRVSASAVHGRVVVQSMTPVSAMALERAINTAGYDVGVTPWVESDVVVWATAGAGVGLVALLAVIAQVAGIGNLATGVGDLSTGGLAVSLLLGLAAGVSTCMALVGGLVLGISASFTGARAPSVGTVGRLHPALVFIVGRIAGYATFGAVLGAVGASLWLPPQVTAVLMLSVAVVMTIVGARLTGLSPRLAGWSPTLPMGIGVTLGLGGAATGGYSDGRTAALGAASFFLPCGFTQAIQIYALSTGSPLFAGALLATFAVGTAPGLLALAGLPAVVPSRARPTLLRLVGVVVLAFAFLNGSAGVRLTGLTLPSLVGTASAAPLPGTLGSDGVQAITTYQDAEGYRPSNVVIYAGYPVRWTIQSSTTATCAASLWAPGVNVRMRLDRGPNLIELPPLPAGVLDYTCAMGMYGGRITVVEPPPGPPGD